VVVDGRVRDLAELRTSGLAVYAREVTPAGRDWGGEVNVVVRCGGVEVAPCAVIVGDDDGVVVLPADGRPELLARCRERMASETARQAGAWTMQGGRAWRFPA
jgi:4-hydroxy-4-methyl-2-oxoglutarate aldolase